MVKFNTSWLPVGTAIQSARLKLYVQSVAMVDLQSAPINVHTLIQDWTQDAVSWTRRTATANWSTSGGSASVVALASVEFSALTSGSWLVLDLPASTVQSWADSPASNYGLILKRNPDGNPGTAFRHNKATFASSEHPSVDLRPKLEITFTTAANALPMACVSSPVSGTASAPNYPLLIQANAGDADGSITRVDFLAGTNWLASDYSAPFSFRWQHVPGSTNVSIIARAYDNFGASADSAPVPVRIQSTIYSANMDSDPGWTLGSGWQFGKPSGCYWADYSTDEGDPFSGHTGNNVIGYLFNDVLPALSSAVCAVTPAIDCRGYSNVVLTFFYWLGIGEANSNFKAGVDISTDGTSWQSLWTNPGERMTVGLWRRMALNISAIADGKPTVYIRWTMGPGNSYPFCGWNIDDVEVLGSAPPPVITDADGDGMPDNWEIACFGNTSHIASEDWDGDGLSNYQEYLAGTAPTGSTNALQLRFAPFNRDAILFDAVEAEAGYYLVPRYYSLESRTNLLSGQWTGVPGLTNILGENQPVAYTNAAPSSAFYRLRSWLP